MLILDEEISQYLSQCRIKKELNPLTLKAYWIDLGQFSAFAAGRIWTEREAIDRYIDLLHARYKPKTIKRKTASLKAFFHYLEEEEKIALNPFHKIRLNFREAFILPKTISVPNIARLLDRSYLVQGELTQYQSFCRLRNVCVLELLFATGMRVSEAAHLTLKDLDWNARTIRIFGKGAKERMIQLTNPDVIGIVGQYLDRRTAIGMEQPYLFLNRDGGRYSEQSIRNMIQKYTREAGIREHITPHMFRHTFATLLLEEDVDIRYIQHMLGHSSITTTQIYTHVSTRKQRIILEKHHPRNFIQVCSNGGSIDGAG